MPLPPCRFRIRGPKRSGPQTCWPASASPLRPTSCTARCSRRPSRTCSPRSRACSPPWTPSTSGAWSRRRTTMPGSSGTTLRAVFDGPALVFSAARDGHARAAAESWSGHVRSVTDHAVDSTHWRICAPDALAVIGPILAEHLRDSEMPEMPAPVVEPEGCRLGPTPRSRRAATAELASSARADRRGSASCYRTTGWRIGRNRPGTVVHVEIHADGHTGNPAAVGVLPERPGRPPARHLGRRVPAVVGDPQRVGGELIRVRHRSLPEVRVRVDDRLTAGQAHAPCSGSGASSRSAHPAPTHPSARDPAPVADRRDR